MRSANDFYQITMSTFRTMDMRAPLVCFLQQQTLSLMRGQQINDQKKIVALLILLNAATRVINQPASETITSLIEGSLQVMSDDVLALMSNESNRIEPSAEYLRAILAGEDKKQVKKRMNGKPWVLESKHAMHNRPSLGLQKPVSDMGESGLLRTDGEYGWEFPLSFLAVDEFTRAFADSVSGDTKKRVLVLGAAFGTLVNQLLENSRHNGSKFVVNDLSDNQMAIFKDALLREFDSRVTIVSGNFLEAADFPPNHFDHILLQNVAHFFNPEQAEIFFNRAQLWLKEGGSLTVTCCTPFWQIHHMMRNEQGEDNIAVFEHKKAAGDPWPGYFSDIQARLLAMQHPIAAKAPTRVHAFDPETLSRTMTRYGLTTTRSDFFKMPQTFPPFMQLDGRENVGAVAIKPSLKK